MWSITVPREGTRIKLGKKQRWTEANEGNSQGSKDLRSACWALYPAWLRKTISNRWTPSKSYRLRNFPGQIVTKIFFLHGIFLPQFHRTELVSWSTSSTHDPILISASVILLLFFAALFPLFMSLLLPCRCQLLSVLYIFLMALLVFYCCLNNCHKHRNFKQHGLLISQFL